MQTVASAAATEIAEAANELVARRDYKRFGDLMLTALDTYRRSIAEEEWNEQAIPFFRAQRFYCTAQEDPFSRRSTVKPRGYPGDAHLIDFLYKHDAIGDELLSSSPAGQALCNYWTNSPAARAVRDRKVYFTRQVVRTLTACPCARLFILACGHLREAEALVHSGILSSARITCLDQDRESCNVVERYYGPSVRVINKSLAHAMRVKEGGFKLIYAAGLYDYLKDGVATKLNARMVQLLAPGGRLVIPNFLRSAPNRASMELLQDWHLIYRSKAELLGLVPEIEQPHEIQYFEDKHATVGYVVVDVLE